MASAHVPRRYPQTTVLRGAERRILRRESSFVMSHEHEVRAQVHATCRRMVDDGLVIGSAGNVSMRLDPHRIVVSPAGIAYERFGPEDLAVVDLRDGTWVGPHRPTSELSLHLTLMAELAEVGAIVHTHSVHAAAFAVAHLDLPFICNESLASRAEAVRVTDYAAPGSAALGAEALATFRAQPGSRAVLLANHGVVAAAPTMDEAYVVAQSVEWTAHILSVARQLGGEHILSAEIQDTIAANYDVTIARAAPTGDAHTRVRTGEP